jgi:hypothetical protein
MLEGGCKNMFDPEIMRAPPKKGLNTSGMTNGPLLQNNFHLITVGTDTTKHEAFQTETVASDLPRRLPGI